MKQIFALVDCNSFYCSCEKLFRPELEGKPVGVLSNNDGCFVSRTKELKELGVKMAQPYFQVKDLCEKHNVAVFSANFANYTNISDRVMKTLEKFTPELEIYSVDEAFLNLSGFDEAKLDSYCREIKRIVERDTGIPVGIGVGYTKTLAKIANNIAKKSKKSKGVVCLLSEKHTDIALQRTEIGDVWGIGRASKEKMTRLGIHTAYDLKKFPDENKILKTFTKTGLETLEELKGLVRRKLEPTSEKKKEIISSRSFANPVYDLESLKESISSFTTNAVDKLRKQDSRCSKIAVYARTSPHKDGPQYEGYEEVSFKSPTSDTLKIINYALMALEKIYKKDYEYKKAGVKLSAISDAHQAQLSFLDNTDSLNSDKLMNTIDDINGLYGPNTIKSGACGTNDYAWKMNKNFRSPNYLSGYGELPKTN